ncbi:hypothetical protein ACTI_37710 [Actinoplanes sp. OR16]|uniref:rolling circle replication-associated protein n=1 Tax=Actinoplanes sp. OR16 TaxID=946334 RepID=UPI000F718C61|nr:hypothetical protein [Actinoplanes sp. OR16]BBH67086.1 hypothetical protein ACTI_37710 [Actinoplanes sp. OR16]
MTTVHTQALVLAVPGDRDAESPGGTQEATGVGGPAADRANGTAEGLVTCVRTARLFTPPPPARWEPAFPTPELVSFAVDLLPRRDAWDGHEGPRPRILIAPGCIAIERPDLAKKERAQERERRRRQVAADLAAAHYLAHGEYPDDPEPSREVTSWSRRSRARMVRRMCELDYAPLLADPERVPAMVTLTYPGEWQTVAPDGKALKAHLTTFRLRWKRAWGAAPVGVWKLEFQRRGAPHVHILTVPPHGVARTPRRGVRPVGAGMAFTAWLSATWADVVNHPDPVQRMRHERAGTGVDFAEGLRARDPRRVAVYFTKHGTFADKEYQHIVPEEWRKPGHGPGRFWGYWELKTAVSGVEVTPDVQIAAARVLRRWARAQGTTRRVVVPRVDTTTGRLRLRPVRRRVKRLASGSGWVSVNDGAAFASQLARYLTDRARSASPGDNRRHILLHPTPTHRLHIFAGQSRARRRPPANRPAGRRDRRRSARPTLLASRIR